MTIPLTLRPRQAVVAVLATLAVALSGCGAVDTLTSTVTGPEDAVAECPEKPLPAAAPGLVLAVSVHQGAPAPGLPASLQPLLEATLAEGHPVRVVTIDGEPAVAPVQTGEVSTATCDAFRTTLQDATARVVDTIRTAQASADGNDLYAAVGLAAATATAMPDGTLVVVVDSGLSDRAPLDFTRAGMTLTNPAEAAAFAARTQPIPEVSGLRFLLLLGYTAHPQPALSSAERENVTATWAATLTALGASEVTADTTPRTGPGPETSYVTTPAPVVQARAFEPPATDMPTTTVFHEDQIRFLPDSTELADPDAAAQALREVIAWLRDEPRHVITITGTTSSAGTEDGRLRLSRHRADTVKQLVLRAPGAAIAADQVETEGVGTHFPEFIADRRPDGTLDQFIAPANRTVRITAHPPA